MASYGQTINPYSVTMKNKKKEAEFTTPHGIYRMELRSGYYDGALWLWIRSTVNWAYHNDQNSGWGSTAKLSVNYDKAPITTLPRVATRLPYGSGKSTRPGSQRCSAAICVSGATRGFRVKFEGPGTVDKTSKTTRIYTPTRG